MHLHLDKELTRQLIATTLVVSVVWHVPEIALHVAKEHLFPHSKTESATAIKPAPNPIDEKVASLLAQNGYEIAGLPHVHLQKPGSSVYESYNPGFYEQYGAQTQIGAQRKR